MRRVRLVWDSQQVLSLYQPNYLKMTVYLPFFCCSSRLMCTFLLALAFRTPYTLRAEEVLSQKIDLQFQDIPLKEALDLVAQKGDFIWSYNAQIIPGNKKMSLSVKQWTIREVLYTLLGEGYRFIARDQYVILKKVYKPSNEAFGYIKDEKTGARILGATVLDPKTLRATTTDSNGYYRLKLGNQINTDLVVMKSGFLDGSLSLGPQASRYQALTLVPSPQEALQQRPNKPIAWSAFTRKSAQVFHATIEKWHDQNVRDSIHRNWQVSFLPKIGTNHHLSGKVANDWSLNVISGYSRGVYIAEIGGVANFTKSFVCGIQVAGVYNQSQGPVRGVQIAGAANTTLDTLQGLQIGGVQNYSAYSDGLGQIGGVGNYTGKGNITLQVGGAYNRADSIQAVQIAGVVNLANSAKGVQIAGILNNTRHMKGVQIGLINRTSDCECIQIGLLNQIGSRWLPFVNAKRKRSKIHP